jgi:hypothetical protein
MLEASGKKESRCLPRREAMMAMLDAPIWSFRQLDAGRKCCKTAAVKTSPATLGRKRLGYWPRECARRITFAGQAGELGAWRRTFVKCTCIAAALAALHITGNPSLEGYTRGTGHALQFSARVARAMSSNCSSTNPCPAYHAALAKMLQKSKRHRPSSRTPHDRTGPDVYAAGYTRRKTSLRT